MIWFSPVQVIHHRLMDTLGIEITEVGDDYLCAKMPVDERTLQPFGSLHGGATCVLAEALGSMAANFCVDSSKFCVGVEINVNHLKAVRSGFVIATAKPLHLGKSTQVWDIQIRNEENQLIAVSRLTMAVLKK